MNIEFAFASPEKSGKLVGTSGNVSGGCIGFRDSGMIEGVYVFKRFLNIDLSHSNVVKTTGPRVLLFTKAGSAEDFYIYGQSDPYAALPNSLAIPASDFNWLWDKVLLGVSKLTVKRKMFMFGMERGNMRKYSIHEPLSAFEEKPFEIKPLDLGSVSKKADPVKAAESFFRDSTPSSKASTQPKSKSTASHRTTTSSSVHRSSYTTRDNSSDVDAVDFMFMSMYPEVAPIYRPNSFLAWYLWSQHRNENTGYVPGFPDACSQRITPYGNGERVELLDANGYSVGSFVVNYGSDSASFVTQGGNTFNVQGTTQPQFSYENGTGQDFYWNGVDAPVVDRNIYVPAETFEDSTARNGDGFEFDVPEVLRDAPQEPERADYYREPTSSPKFEFEVPVSMQDRSFDREGSTPVVEEQRYSSSSTYEPNLNADTAY